MDFRELAFGKHVGWQWTEGIGKDLGKSEGEKKGKPHSPSPKGSTPRFLPSLVVTFRKHVRLSMKGENARKKVNANGSERERLHQG